MTLDEAPDILKPREAQEFLRVGRNQLYALLASGALFSVRIGASYRIPKESIKRLLAGDRSEDALEGSAPGHQPEAEFGHRQLGNHGVRRTA